MTTVGWQLVQDWLDKFGAYRMNAYDRQMATTIDKAINAAIADALEEAARCVDLFAQKLRELSKDEMLMGYSIRARCLEETAFDVDSGLAAKLRTLARERTGGGG